MMRKQGELKERIRRVRELMEKEGLKALLLLDSRNVLYLSGQASGAALITEKSAHLWVKELYRELYSDFYDTLCPFNVHDLKKDAIKGYVKRGKFRGMGVENPTIERFSALKKELQVKLLPNDLMKRVRAIKSAYEISQLKKAAAIAKEGMKKAYEVVQVGVLETDALTEIEARIRRLGSDEPPFGGGALLSSGKNAANIHALSQKKKMRKNTAVVVDLGAKVNGYYSDMTRTIKLGKLNRQQEVVFELVKNLEIEAIDKIKEGLAAKELHNFVEKRIEGAGYKFHHNSGHGVGLDIHELPNLGPLSEDSLQKGMVFTIEPGIYLPGKIGVRFEDMVVLRKGGVEVLTAI